MMHEQNGQGRAPEAGIRLLNLVAVVVRRWRTVVGITLGVVLGALVVVSLQSETYTAVTVLVPSTSRTSSANQLLGGSQLPLGLLGGSTSGQELIAVVARSRRLADAMVERLAGTGGGGETTESREEMEKTVRETLDRTELRTSSDGSIVISVSGEDPDVAARAANEYPVLINDITTQLTAQSARRREGFLEQQLVQARTRLEESEQRLVEFQKGQNVPEIQEQARRAIDAAAELQRGIIEQELRVAQLRRAAGPENAELRAALAELDARREQLRRLTSGGRSGSQLFPSLRESPQLKTNATRLLREFTKNEQVYLSLTAALADAQIEGNRTLPVVSVLDPALVPRAPSAPNVRMVLGLAAVLGLVLGIAAAFVREYANGARRDPENEPFFIALDEFRTDVSRFVPFRRKAGNGRLVGTNRGV